MDTLSIVDYIREFLFGICNVLLLRSDVKPVDFQAISFQEDANKYVACFGLNDVFHFRRVGFRTAMNKYVCLWTQNSFSLSRIQGLEHNGLGSFKPKRLQC